MGGGISGDKEDGRVYGVLTLAKYSVVLPSCPPENSVVGGHFNTDLE